MRSSIASQATVDRRRLAAFHEAGHVVMYRLKQEAVGAASIDEEGNGVAWTSGWRGPTDHAVLPTTLGGPIAERLAGSEIRIVPSVETIEYLIESIEWEGPLELPIRDDQRLVLAAVGAPPVWAPQWCPRCNADFQYVVDRTHVLSTWQGACVTATGRPLRRRVHMLRWRALEYRRQKWDTAAADPGAVRTEILRHVPRVRRQLRRHWAAVTAIAAELIKHGAASAGRLRQILERHRVPE